MTKKILRILEAERIPIEEFHKMVKRSAICTVEDERFNRRFHHWLFQISKDTGEVLDMRLYEDVPTEGHGDTPVSEVHNACEGEGCRLCSWTGFIRRLVTDSSEKTLNDSYHSH